ncbi:MAG: class I SAM-dependent methyltransferase [Sulfuricurvum sp.]|uniref:class I SAM-dependent methyltransferase n=1 Tax=Sulfuricurvum sp. TaxID=2025608 RepID=UPI002613E4AA|nr:class I SAM-dependent methyltransferase [Sulfuricurvum sp.]MDD2829165.1 class I SAM-dependent methyltransferase [Sulfuricurvum sp.]MDD4950214.1 class I SAM-dependent methyltransferase [Sulfuricurvum sp.]
MKHTNHYDSLAEKFNDLWQFSSEYKDFVNQYIHYTLELNSNDTLVDIGGGTGTFTQRLAQEAGLTKAYCVEPSPKMCCEASLLDGIEAICTDAEGFIAHHLSYTKMLFKEVIHHLAERSHLWEQVYQQLPLQGKLLIITRPQEVEFPFWQKAKDAFKSHQPPFSLLQKELEHAGFRVNILSDAHTFQLSKEDWFTMLRYRFMSDLSDFSDEEIDEGIKEIDLLYSDAYLEIKDYLLFITATK